MDTGLDKQQIEDFKRWVATVSANPAKLKLYVCLLLFGIGYLAVVRPLGQRLAEAQTKLKNGKVAAARAAAAAHYVEQRGLYEDKLTNRDDVVYWQNYITDLLDQSGCRLSSLDPGEATEKFTFKIVRMQLTATADDYQDIVDFIDRIEHGKHIVRLELLAIDEMNDGLQLTCSLHALVEPGLRMPGGKPLSTTTDPSQADSPQGVSGDPSAAVTDAGAGPSGTPPLASTGSDAAAQPPPVPTTAPGDAANAVSPGPAGGPDDG